MYRSTKRFDGYSTCFRQWRAVHSHCQYLHGYAIEVRVEFEGKLDDRNWVVDFGRFKTDGIKAWLSNMFDHTTIVASDDPKIDHFRKLEEEGLIQLRIVPNVGCEKFAEMIYLYLSTQIDNDRVKVASVEVFENGKNSAIVHKMGESRISYLVSQYPTLH